MIRLFFSFLCILLGFVSVANAAAPQLKSQSWILVDRLTHTTLANKNADVRTNPGNTVLLMVLYTAEKAINEKIISRTSSITVNNDALSIPPVNAARFYLEPNQSVTVSDLEKAIAVSRLTTYIVHCPQWKSPFFSGNNLMNQNPPLTFRPGIIPYALASIPQQHLDIRIIQSISAFLHYHQAL